MIKVIDTETTDLKGEIIEIAVVNLTEGGEYVSSLSHLCKPVGRISWSAMGLHGITNEMVSNQPSFAQIKHFYLPDDNTQYVVGHNLQYDIGMFGDGHEDVKQICTLKLARKLIDKKECGDHKNTTLYYYLGCDKLGKIECGVPHRAEYDAIVTSRVLKALMDKFELTIHQCYDLIQINDNQQDICNFPKHKGKPWKKVLTEDKQYVQWLLDSGKFNDPDDKKFVIELMKEM